MSAPETGGRDGEQEPGRPEGAMTTLAGVMAALPGEPKPPDAWVADIFR